MERESETPSVRSDRTEVLVREIMKRLHLSRPEAAAFALRMLIIEVRIALSTAQLVTASAQL
ncbi:MAG: hypothetical protein Kow0099_32700 [Candidatus Abyssubacteria bacterium]